MSNELKPMKDMSIEDLRDEVRRLRAAEFWGRFVFPEGADPEQIKTELEDYAMMLDEVTQVYSSITNGRIAKPNTMAFEVIAVAEDMTNELIREEVKNAEEDICVRMFRMDPIRESVVFFAMAMEERLKANDEEKGVEGWKHLARHELMIELNAQIDKLRRTLLPSDGTPEQILKAAAGVANIAHMIADNWGGLREGIENLAISGDCVKQLDTRLRMLAAEARESLDQQVAVDAETLGAVVKALAVQSGASDG